VILATQELQVMSARTRQGVLEKHTNGHHPVAQQQDELVPIE
jgi:hypothetical protein